MSATPPAPAEPDTGPAALAAAVGVPRPPGRWVPLTPETVRRFARLTGDDQGLHGASGGTAPAEGAVVVQGALLVALAAGLLGEVYDLPWSGAQWQVGYDKVRFRAPVRAGESVRLRATPQRVRRRAGGREVWLSTDLSLERRGAAGPAMTARFHSVIAVRAP